MITEVEKICPEERQFDAQNLDIDNIIQDNATQAMTE
jgi:hypothetical protein